MQYRTLGRSGLRVSALCLGTMTFGGRPPFDRTGATDAAGAKRMIDACLDAGVNFVDTADIYSKGVAEEIVGEAIAGRRERIVLATKARFRMGEGQNDAGLSRQHLIAACEASLKRLGTDVIDLYQLHQWDGITPLEETLAALDTLVQHGKVRYVGVSNFSGWHVMKALSLADRDRRPRFVSQQIHYTLQAREAEYELVPISLDQGLGILVWSPLAGGLLSGKFRRDARRPEGSRHLAGWKEPPVRDEEKLYEIIDTLLSVADTRGVSAAQVALAWLLTRPGVASVVIGARTEAQLADNLAASDLVLTPEELARLEEVSRPALLYPYWHQAWTASDRLGSADLALLAPFLAKG